MGGADDHPYIRSIWDAGAAPDPDAVPADGHVGRYGALVADNVDPMEEHRLNVKIPEVLGDDTTACAKAAPNLAAAESAVPDIGTEVWIEFESGDPNYPIWVGVASRKCSTHDVTPVPQYAGCVLRPVDQHGRHAARASRIESLSVLQVPRASAPTRSSTASNARPCLSRTSKEAEDTSSLSRYTGVSAFASAQESRGLTTNCWVQAHNDSAPDPFAGDYRLSRNDSFSRRR